MGTLLERFDEHDGKAIPTTLNTNASFSTSIQQVLYAVSHFIQRNRCLSREVTTIKLKSGTIRHVDAYSRLTAILTTFARFVSTMSIPGFCQLRTIRPFVFGTGSRELASPCWPDTVTTSWVLLSIQRTTLLYQHRWIKRFVCGTYLVSKEAVVWSIYGRT